MLQSRFSIQSALRRGGEQTDGKSIMRPRTGLIRRALGLCQREFFAEFHLARCAPREQGRKEPEAAARAYLTVIGCEPEAVGRAILAGV